MSKTSSAKPSHWRWIWLGVALCSPGPIVCGQTTAAFGIIVERKLIIGLVGKSPQVLKRSDIARLPHKAVKVKISGKTSTYSGVLLRELLEYAAAISNADRKQVNFGSVVVIESVDGPSVLFAMAEFDGALTDKRVLLADGKDGKPLAAPEGPFRIIVPDEKEPTRWARQVWAIYIAQISGP